MKRPVGCEPAETIKAPITPELLSASEAAVISRWPVTAACSSCPDDDQLDMRSQVNIEVDCGRTQRER